MGGSSVPSGPAFVFSAIFCLNKASFPFFFFWLRYVFIKKKTVAIVNTNEITPTSNNPFLMLISRRLQIGQFFRMPVFQFLFFYPSISASLIIVPLIIIRKKGYPDRTVRNENEGVFCFILILLIIAVRRHNLHQAAGFFLQAWQSAIQ